MADSESVGGELDTEGADDQIVSLDDVLNDEQQLQDDANAVLGACDDNICTYSQVGYIQHLCTVSAKKTLFVKNLKCVNGNLVSDVLSTTHADRH